MMALAAGRLDRAAALLELIGRFQSSRGDGTDIETRYTHRLCKFGHAIDWMPGRHWKVEQLEQYRRVGDTEVECGRGPTCSAAAPLVNSVTQCADLYQQQGSTHARLQEHQRVTALQVPTTLSLRGAGRSCAASALPPLDPCGCSSSGPRGTPIVKGRALLESTLVHLPTTPRPPWRVTCSPWGGPMMVAAPVMVTRFAFLVRSNLCRRLIGNPLADALDLPQVQWALRSTSA